MGVPPMFCFFLDYSDSSRTLVRRHTGAHCQLPQKVIRIDRFLSSVVSRNIVALGGKEGGGVGASEATPLNYWKGARTVLRRLRDRCTAHPCRHLFLELLTLYLHCDFEENCEIDMQHTPTTSLFQISYTLLTLLGFVWDSVCFGIPRSAQTYGPGTGPAGSPGRMPILAPNAGPE